MKTHALVLTIGSILGAAAASGTATAAPASDADTMAELQQQIASLQAEVAQLRSGNGDDWLTEARADEIRNIVHDVLADADTRASLLGSGLTAGWDGGFKIGSADGNYSLKIGGRLQVRYVYNFQDTPPAGGDRHRSGFENRRTRLAFSGHVIDPSWKYKIQGNFSRSSGTFGLLDAHVDKVFDNGLTLRIGQFKPRFMHEDNTSSARQLAVERSAVNGVFGQSRSQGLELHGKAGDTVKWSIGYIEGIGVNSPGGVGGGTNTAALARTTEFGFIARAEMLAAGEWGQFRDFTSWSDEEFGLLLGAGIAFQRDEFGTPTPGEVEMFRWTVDATAKFGGVGAFVAFVGNHEEINNGAEADQYGFVVQGSAFIVPDEWEAFVRYEWGDADMTGVEDLSFITLGVNYYMAKHNLKWQSDLGIGIEELAGFWASSSRGTRADAAGEDTQLVFRSQLQLVF